MGREQHAANCVSWQQASQYCSWLGSDYRLPTEAEWEKAARGGLVGYEYPWGPYPPTCTMGLPNTVVWKEAGSPGCGQGSTWPAGSGGAKNGLGLLGTAGNVAEWVEDWYSKTYFANSPASNPRGPPASSSRVIRGGSFMSDYSRDLRCSERDYQAQETASFAVGFRCAKTP